MDDMAEIRRAARQRKRIAREKRPLELRKIEALELIADILESIQEDIQDIACNTDPSLRS